jgi:hypothetical protein
MSKGRSQILKMVNKNKLDRMLFVVAIIVIFLALINLGFTLYKFGGMNGLTGNVVTGTANLSIQSVAVANFTTLTINWGDGAVADNAPSATLDSSNGTITNWNGSSNNIGLILQNDGNVNLRINLTASNDAAGFIGGTSPLYEIKTVATGEAGSCTGLSSTYWTANTTMMNSCSNLSYINTKDTVRIDVRVVVPNDAVIGVKGSTITATATAIA